MRALKAHLRALQLHDLPSNLDALEHGYNLGWDMIPDALIPDFDTPEPDPEVLEADPDASVLDLDVPEVDPDTPEPDLDTPLP